MTKTELIKRVLIKLKVIQSDDTVSTEDSDLIGAVYDEVYQELKIQELVTWTSTGDIPTSHAQSMIKIVASRSADDFEHEELNVQRLLIEESQAMDKIVILNRVPYVSTSEPECY